MLARRFTLFVLSFALVGVAACESPTESAPFAALDDGPAFSHVPANEALPSTNDANRDNGWAHFNVLELAPGEVTVEFVSTRNFVSCFEYRVDGSEPDAPGNPNSDVHGLWPFTCVINGTAVTTLAAAELVEIRMAFGAETDERFDWTAIEIPGKDSCKDGGWEALGFKNQGQCIRWINTGKDSR